jgi:hypothetical protein
VFEDRDVDVRDNGSSSGWSDVPLQAAEIVVHLRRPCCANHEWRSFLKNTLDLRVESVVADDLLLRFKELAVRSVGLRDQGCSPRGIPLPEYFEQVPFRQRTEYVVHS